MAKEIKAGVLIDLQDRFSSKIKGTGGAVDSFVNQSKSAIQGLDKVFSGTAAKLGALGVGLSLGGATRTMVELDHSVTRMGLTFNATAEETAKLKQGIYDTALKYTVDAALIREAADTLLTNTGDIDFVNANWDNLGQTIQGAGTDGKQAAEIFTQYFQFGKTAKEIQELNDSFVKMGDTGKYTMAEFAATGTAVMAKYSASVGNTHDDLKAMYTAMLAVRAGVAGLENSKTAFEGMFNDLSSADTQQKLRDKYGIDVIDKQTGKLKSVLAIGKELKRVTEQKGNVFWLSEIFGETGLRGWQAVIDYADSFEGKIADLGDTTGALKSKADVMAGTFKSNLQALHTSFDQFADTNMGKVLDPLAKSLSWLAEDPARFDAVFRAITKGLMGIAAVKLTSGAFQLFEQIKGMSGAGGNVFMPGAGGLGALGTSGGGTVPVFVTNWGGTGAGAMPGMTGMAGVAPGGSGLIGLDGKPLRSTAMPATNTPKGIKGRLTGANFKGSLKSAGAGAAVGAVLALPGSISDVASIQGSDATKEEKGRATGAAVGSTAGSVAGGAAGAVIGSLILPGIGTAIGGYLGSTLGDMVGGREHRRSGGAGRYAEAGIRKSRRNDNHHGGCSAARHHAGAMEASAGEQQRLGHGGDVGSEKRPS